MAKMTVNRDTCKGCGLCVQVCPKKIISLDKKALNQKGYHPACVEDMSKCIGCAGRSAPGRTVCKERQ